VPRRGCKCECRVSLKGFFSEEFAWFPDWGGCWQVFCSCLRPSVSLAPWPWSWVAGGKERAVGSSHTARTRFGKKIKSSLFGFECSGERRGTRSSSECKVAEQW
jgi:hypothetical protein